MFYKVDDRDWQRMCIDDFTPRKKLLRFLATFKMLEPAADDWRDILKKYREWALRSYVSAPVYVGKRSSVIWKIGRTLAERGASGDEISCVLLASKCWQSKWGNNKKALARQVAKMMRVK